MSALPAAVAIAPGVYPDLPMEQYLAIHAVSGGFLAKMKRSPAHAKYAIEHPQPSTEAMDNGSLVDAMILDAVELAGRFVVRPNTWKDWRTDASKAWRVEQHAAGKVVVTAEQWALAEAMRDALYEHPGTRDLLWSPERRCQQSIIWRDGLSGLLCKARPDAWVDNVLVNLKSTADARPPAFSRVAESKGYWVGAAHYLTGAHAATGTEHIYCWCVVEQEPPHGIRVYSTHDDDGWSTGLLAAELEWRALMDLISECSASGAWPCYPIQIEQLRRPKWALERLEFDE